jgi:hypothetical protein
VTFTSRCGHRRQPGQHFHYWPLSCAQDLTRVALQASKDLEESKKAGSSLNYIHPTDRNGKLCKDVLSTEEIEDSLHDYRDACDDAHAQVKNQLRRLAAELQVSPKKDIVARMLSVQADLFHSTSYLRLAYDLQRLNSAMQPAIC